MVLPKRDTEGCSEQVWEKEATFILTFLTYISICTIL